MGDGLGLGTYISVDNKNTRTLGAGGYPTINRIEAGEKSKLTLNWQLKIQIKVASSIITKEQKSEVRYYIFYIHF